MPKRTSVTDAKQVETADDLDVTVKDKRQGWRATLAKACRRYRRYTKRMTDDIARHAYDGEYETND